MSRRNAISGPACNALKCLWGPWSMASYVLFLKRPARFDRIEVWRVRRQIEDAHAALLACGRDSLVVMGRQVIHDDHITGCKLRQERRSEPSNEAVLGRGS